MKIKLDGKNITTLKSAENYRKWKQEVQMLCSAYGVSYLLTETPPNLPSITPTTTPIAQPVEQGGSGNPVNISTAAKGKAKAIDDDDEDHISPFKWKQENEQMVSQLYFYVADIYKPLFVSLVDKTLFNLFGLLDKQFISQDTMLVVAKRTELDNFKFTINKSFPEQIIKFEELKQQLSEIGG